MTKTNPADLERASRALAAAGGNVTKAAKALRIPRSTLQGRLHSVVKVGSVKAAPAGVPAAAQHKVEPTVASTRVYLLTSAQDETDVYSGALKNLIAYAGYRDAQILCGGFTYQKGLFEDHKVATGVYRRELHEFLSPKNVQLAPRLTWYGSANILPTAVDPLTGWDTQTRDSWAIFPHAKISLRCIPVMPGRPGKQIMTTGVITVPNYVQRNAGQKAEFHHTPGATIVEVKPNGTFFVRQLSMMNDGSFQDLDVLVRGGTIERGPSIEALNAGDIHLEEMDPDVARITWGYSIEQGRCVESHSMIDDLRPKYQFIHDSFDFKPRSPHTRNDPHERSSRLIDGNDSVQRMLRDTARFIAKTKRDFCTTVHVSSNHNIHLERWLKDPDGHFDPVNARVWHRLNEAWFAALENQEGGFIPHAHGLQNAGYDISDVVFLREGQSFTICQGTQPVECGLHGHMGPRGAKGSPAAFAKIVERINGGHIHEPAIKEAAYFAGTSSKMPSPQAMRYASKGPGAWHHSHVVTYQSGKRTVITLSNGEYRA